MLPNITVEELKGFYKGACHFAVSDGFLSAFHYCQKQIDHMSRETFDMDWRLRGMFSGGIRIEFITDSTEISFDTRNNNKTTHNYIDLYVDDKLECNYKIEDMKYCNVHFTLKEGEKKVTIYLPTDSKLEICNFKINGLYIHTCNKASRGRRNVLLIGDSISQGYGPTYPSCAYVNALMRKTRLNILNQGIGGYRFEPKDVMAVEGFNPSRVIVALGTNYYDEPCLELFGYDYEKSTVGFFEKLHQVYGNLPTLVVTPLWRCNGEVDYERLSWCTSIITRECRKYENITVVDGFDLVPNVEMCFSDGIHPNEYGSELLAANLANVIKSLKW